MPIYEYLCTDCRILFERRLTLAAHDREAITCPKCGSNNIKQALTTFYPVTSRKSA
jgi:putative FmdB family regulatory protein